MTETALSTDNRDGVLVVTLDRPDALNAFTTAMADELEALFRAVNDDKAVVGVVVTGAGRAFCAGMDLTIDGNVFGLDETQQPSLTDMQRPRRPEVESGVRDTGGRVALAIFDCLKPVVAAINGPAVGIGATMTLPMDARIAAESARLGLVFGRIGITPEAASTWFLPRIVGLPTALDLLLSARILTAEEAHDCGLVDEVVPDDELVDRAVELIRSWTTGRSAVAVAMTRQLLYRNAGLATPHEAHNVDSLSIFYLSQLDGAEGVAAFREKRPASFRSTVPDDLPPFFAEWTGTAPPTD